MTGVWMREHELYVRHLPLSCTLGCTGGQPLPVVVLLSLVVGEVGAC